VGTPILTRSRLPHRHPHRNAGQYDHNTSLFCHAGDVTSLPEPAAEAVASLPPAPSTTDRAFRLLVESVRDYAIFSLDPSGIVTSWNAGAEHIKGYRAEEIVGRHFSAFYLPDDVAAGKPDDELLVAGAEGRFEEEGWRVRKDGTRFWASVVITALHDETGTLCGFGKVTRDVTTRRETEGALRRSGAFREALLATSPAVTSLFDPATDTTVWSSRSRIDLPGFGPGDGTGRTPTVDEIVHPGDLAAYHDANARAAGLGEGEVVELRHRVRGAGRDQRWVQRRMTPFRHGDRRALVLAATTDVTSQVELEADLLHMALHDSLTSLPNRRLVHETLDRTVADQGSNGPVWVLSCDLDGFKRINDEFGHAAGDAVLVATAQRLRAGVRPGDTVGRMGGDEFVVILVDRVSEHEAADVARRLCRALAEPLAVLGTTHRLTASIGLTALRQADDADALLASADAALYRAKAAGKNTVAG
jgi:diguanylate cyclase (GGDEF)-like protein/PAS domain S-box-containing protein